MGRPYFVQMFTNLIACFLSGMQMEGGMIMPPMIPPMISPMGGAGGIAFFISNYYF